MAQKVYDHFAKQYLAYILDDKGKFWKSFSWTGFAIPFVTFSSV